MNYPKNYIAIDIGNERIKIAELSKKKDKIIIKQYVVLNTPENSINDGFILDKMLISEVINKALIEEKFKNKNLVFTISSSKIITREVEFPKLKPNKLKKVIHMNASDYFPVDLNEYTLDYIVTDTVIVNEESVLKVDIIAALDSLIQDYVELSELIGLKLIGIDYAGNSLTNFIKKEKKEGSYMVLDIGSDSTMVSIVNNNILMLNRSILSGTGFLIDYIKNEYEVNKEEAIKIGNEKLLLNFEQSDLESNFNFNNDLNTSMDQILYSISRLLDYYSSRNQGKLDCIYIIGGGSNIYKIDEYISKYFNLKALRLNNFKSVDYKGSKKFSDVEIYFANIIGTAFSNINLVPESLTNKVDSDTKKRTLFLLIILIIVSLAAIFTFMNGQNLVLSKKKAELEDNINKAKEVQEIKLKYETINNKIDFREQILEASKTKSEEFVAILEMMESKMPSDVFYLSMADTGESIEISCIAKDKITVAKFIETIKGMGLFSSVYVPSLTETNSEDGNTGYVSFSISCKY